MSSTEMMTEGATQTPSLAAVDQKLEVVIIPVSDVDRAKNFYQKLGWRLDIDLPVGDEWRIVQMTPPGSPCSIQFGKGLTTARPGSVQGTYLVVDDIEAARAELGARGAPVSVFHLEGFLRVDRTDGRAPGPDPERRTYRTYGSFSDPDGNGWLLQEITTRLPGRGFSTDVASLTELLKEAEEHHGQYEPTAPKHHWSDWYAAYIVARERGRQLNDAVQDAGHHMEVVLGK
jgi:catechol 2,3-dioxygenase-like lactoylglutathione lyase family enzyme